MRQYIKTVLIGMIFLVVGTGLGFALTYPSLKRAENNANYWYNEYNDLQGDYNNLQGDYNELLGEYNDLQSVYNDLLDDYNDLQGDYNDLLDDYNSLFSDYNALRDAFEEPLTNPEIPTYIELYYWLSTDDTDSFEYTENWMCGDFAAMLMTRAKTMNWRMRISCMSYSFAGEIGWQNIFSHYGSHGHAFNVIQVQDRDGDGNNDWIYIEPQTDARWHVIIDSVPYVHYEIWLTFTGGISGTVWSEPYYVNHYNWFA